jgi:hypothetical protein
MSDRALEFLDRWEADHISPLPVAHKGREAVRLAGLCREDAERAGISVVDLQKAANGNLVQNMLNAIEDAAKRRNE